MNTLTAFTLLILAPLASAHSFITLPSAGVRVSSTVRHDINPDPCGAPWKSAHPERLIYERGQKIDINWPRNNHYGGFIQLAVLPLKESGDQKAFYENIFHMGCFETVCHSRNPNDLRGPDPKEYGDNQNMCKSSFTMPTWLENGQYTIQWTWFGGASYRGDKDKGLATYHSCLDFTIKGNQPVAAKPGANVCPVFKGGDSQFPGQDKCSYFLKEGEKEIQPEQCGEGCIGKSSSGKPPKMSKCATASSYGTGSSKNATTPVDTKKNATVVTAPKNTTAVDTTKKNETVVTTPVKNTTDVTTPKNTTTTFPIAGDKNSTSSKNETTTTPSTKKPEPSKAYSDSTTTTLVTPPSTSPSAATVATAKEAQVVTPSGSTGSSGSTASTSPSTVYTSPSTDSTARKTSAKKCRPKHCYGNCS